jgi:hypothetical protein
MMFGEDPVERQALGWCKIQDACVLCCDLMGDEGEGDIWRDGLIKMIKLMKFDEITLMGLMGATDVDVDRDTSIVT